MEEEAAELSICDAILSPLFGDEALPHDEVTRNPFAPEVWRVSSAWLAGRIDDDTALARAGRCDAAEFLFVAGLRALAAGKHDAARASLERSARFGVPGAGGPARSLLTWYALQTAESLAKLSGTGEAKKPVDDF